MALTKAEINALRNLITGLLPNLTTTDKTNLVAAINEVRSTVTAGNITINQRINSAASNFVQTII